MNDEEPDDLFEIAHQHFLSGFISGYISKCLIKPDRNRVRDKLMAMGEVEWAKNAHQYQFLKPKHSQCFVKENIGDK